MRAGHTHFLSLTHTHTHFHFHLQPMSCATSTEEMSSDLETAMLSLIKIFYSHSGREGDKYKLNKGELKTLLREQLSDLSTSNDPSMVEKIMSDLDTNQDGEVDFQEFVIMVAALTVACNEFFMDCVKNEQQQASKKK